MSVVNFLDLKTQYLAIKEEIDAEVIDTLGSTAYVLVQKLKLLRGNLLKSMTLLMVSP